MEALDFFVAYLQPLLPDLLVRLLARLILGRALRQLHALRWPQKELRLVTRVKQLAAEDIAFDTAAANEQHYEVPTNFFLRSLGPRLKYSSCEWPGPDATLEEAEAFSLAKYAELLGVADGQRVLDIGCGWGSFSLYAAERFPKATFVCFSNSSTQIAHISSEAGQKKLANLTAIKMDINTLSPAALAERGVPPPYDRIFACESLEHSRNYQALFARISEIMAPEGRVFVQILGHRECLDLLRYRSAVLESEDANPQTPNPKPQTPNPKPPNPKPQTPRPLKVLIPHERQVLDGPAVLYRGDDPLHDLLPPLHGRPCCLIFGEQGTSGPLILPLKG